MTQVLPVLSKEDMEYLKSGGFSDDAVTEYMRLMTLNRMCIYVLIPSKAVDAVWCHHILNTKMYTKFCDRNFSVYIDRDPRKITRVNYLVTLEKLKTGFDGTFVGNYPASQMHWPPDEYLMPIDSPPPSTLNELKLPILPFHKADLDRASKDVFRKHELLDASTFHSISIIYKKY